MAQVQVLEEEKGAQVQALEGDQVTLVQALEEEAKDLLCTTIVIPCENQIG